MKTVVISETTLYFLLSSSIFPFSFRGEPGACPSPKGIGFVEGHMNDRQIQVQWHGTAEGEFLPSLIAVPPVKRMPLPVGFHPVPSFGKPQGRVVISIGLHEFEVFAIGDKPGRKLVGFQVLLMTGCLIVVAEPVSLIAYFNEASVKTTPF